MSHSRRLRNWSCWFILDATPATAISTHLRGVAVKSRCAFHLCLECLVTSRRMRRPSTYSMMVAQCRDGSADCCGILTRWNKSLRLLWVNAIGYTFSIADTQGLTHSHKDLLGYVWLSAQILGLQSFVLSWIHTICKYYSQTNSKKLYKHKFKNAHLYCALCVKREQDLFYAVRYRVDVGWLIE